MKRPPAYNSLKKECNNNLMQNKKARQMIAETCIKLAEVLRCNNHPKQQLSIENQCNISDKQYRMDKAMQ